MLPDHASGGKIGWGFHFSHFGWPWGHLSRSKGDLKVKYFLNLSKMCVFHRIFGSRWARNVILGSKWGFLRTRFSFLKFLMTLRVRFKVNRSSKGQFPQNFQFLAYHWSQMSILMIVWPRILPPAMSSELWKWNHCHSAFWGICFFCFFCNLSLPGLGSEPLLGIGGKPNSVVWFSSSLEL